MLDPRGNNSANCGRWGSKNTPKAKRKRPLEKRKNKEKKEEEKIKKKERELTKRSPRGNIRSVVPMSCLFLINERPFPCLLEWKQANSLEGNEISEVRQAGGQRFEAKTVLVRGGEGATALEG